MKSAQSKKSIGIAMVIFSVFMLIFSLANFIRLLVDMGGVLWMFFAAVEMLIFSCYILVDAKAQLKNDKQAAAKNKTSAGAAALVFSIFMPIFALLGLLNFGDITNVFAPLIRFWLSIIIFGYAIHLIVAGGAEKKDLQAAPAAPQGGYMPSAQGYAQSAYQQPAQPAYQQPSSDQPSYDQPSYDQPSYDQPSYDQAPYSQPAYTPAEAKVVKCPNCGNRIEASSDSPAISCSACGKKYKNPYYKG